jgi:hypothetical protein
MCTGSPGGTSLIVVIAVAGVGRSMEVLLKSKPPDQRCPSDPPSLGIFQQLQMVLGTTTAG